MVSLPVKQGLRSTEHWHAVATEIVGAALAGGGLSLVLWTPLTWPGVAIAAVGAALSGWTYASYAASRGSVKSAAVRRPADQAPRI